MANLKSSTNDIVVAYKEKKKKWRNWEKIKANEVSHQWLRIIRDDNELLLLLRLCHGVKGGKLEWFNCRISSPGTIWKNNELINDDWGQSIGAGISFLTTGWWKSEADFNYKTSDNWREPPWNPHPRWSFRWLRRSSISHVDCIHHLFTDINWTIHSTEKLKNSSNSSNSSNSINNNNNDDNSKFNWNMLIIPMSRHRIPDCDDWHYLVTDD